MTDETTQNVDENSKVNLPKRVIGSQIPIVQREGGVSVQQMFDIIELARLMSTAGDAVPAHCRNTVGMCWAICLQAIEWRMSPIAVANKSYVVNGRLCYESQLIHAVIEARAPIVGRLNYAISGEGDDMRCQVWATFRGETSPRYFQSDTLGRLKPPKNDRGERKGSPLWEKKPEVQLFYNASRDWCRIYCPDIILGIYSDEELREMEPETPKIAESPNLLARLPGKIEGAGFVDPNAVTADEMAVAEQEVRDAEKKGPEKGKKTRKTTKQQNECSEMSNACDQEEGA